MVHRWAMRLGPPIESKLGPNLAHRWEMGSAYKEMKCIIRKIKYVSNGKYVLEKKKKIFKNFAAIDSPGRRWAHHFR